MDSMEIVRMQHIRDQAWADLTRFAPMVLRLVDGSFGPDDLECIGPMARVVAAELAYRARAVASEEGFEL